MSPVCAIWILSGATPLLEEDLDLARPRPRSRARVGHHRHAGPDRGARRRAVDLLDALVDARLVGGALDERRLDVGSLDALLDVVDEQVRDVVLRAVEQELRQVVVGVDARARDDLQPGLVREPLRRRHVAPEQHRRRLDDRLHPVPLDRLGRLEGQLELAVVLAHVRPLRGDGLVAREEVLVDQRQAELVGVDSAIHGLNSRHQPNLRSSVKRRLARRGTGKDPREQGRISCRDE